jgi:hypothetical protein
VSRRIIAALGRAEPCGDEKAFVYRGIVILGLYVVGSKT